MLTCATSHVRGCKEGGRRACAWMARAQEKPVGSDAKQRSETLDASVSNPVSCTGWIAMSYAYAGPPQSPICCDTARSRKSLNRARTVEHPNLERTTSLHPIEPLALLFAALNIRSRVLVINEAAHERKKEWIAGKRNKEE